MMRLTTRNFRACVFQSQQHNRTQQGRRDSGSNVAFKGHDEQNNWAVSQNGENVSRDECAD
jgi:hypothetical protein